MPPKGKKKKAHVPPEIHPHILKRREADRIKAEKRYARSLKNLRKRKRNNATVVSSGNSEVNFPGSFRYGTNGEENEIQDNVNLPGSSSNESSASEVGKFQAKQENYIGKINKTGKDTAAVQTKSLTESQPGVPKIPQAAYPGGNVAVIGLDHSKGHSNKYSGSDVGKLQVNQETCIGKINKTGIDTAAVQTKYFTKSQPGVSKIPQAAYPGGNVAVIGLDHSKGHSKKSSASEVGKLQAKQETCIGKINKTGKDTAAVQKESFTESQPGVPKIPEAAVPGRNVAEISLDHSKGIPICFSGDKKIPENSSQIQTTTRGEISIEKTTEKESPKSQQPIKSAKCKIDSSKKDLKQLHKNFSDMFRKKRKSEMELRSHESELKCLGEIEENLQPITRLKLPEMAVIGDIKIRKSGKEKNEKRETFAHCDTDKRILRVGDEDVEIIILVRQGEQVICKSNRFKTESDSSRPTCQVMINLEKDAVSDSDHHEKSTTDTKCTSNNIYEPSNQEYQTLENQTIVKSC